MGQFDLQSQYNQTLQNTVGQNQAQRNRELRRQQTPDSSTDWSERQFSGQRFAGAKEFLSEPSMDSETLSTMKGLGVMGNYKDANTAGVYYGNYDPTQASNAGTIMDLAGYKPTEGAYTDELKNAFGQTPAAYSKNYISKGSQYDPTTIPGLQGLMGTLGYKDVTDPWSQRNTDLDFLYQNTDIGKLSDRYFSKNDIPQYTLGDAPDLNKLVTDLWNQRPITQVRKGYTDLTTEQKRENPLLNPLPVMGSDNDPQVQRGYTYDDYGNRTGIQAAPTDQMQDFWNYDNKDYASQAEAEKMRADNLAYILGDKNLARNAYVDMKYGGGTGRYDYFSGEDSVDKGADWEKYSNIGKLGWNGINELVTDPNDVRALFGGQSITDSQGRTLGDLYRGENFIAPTAIERTIDNSHKNKNALIKTDITDITKGGGYQGAQMDFSKLYGVNGGNLYDDATDTLSPTAQMTGDYDRKDAYNRAKELTGLGKVVKTGLQMFGGPFGSIAGLALQGAGGQRPGFGQMLGTFVGMAGGTGSMLGDAAVGAAGSGIDAWRGGARGSDIFKSAAAGGLGGGLGNLGEGYVRDLVGPGMLGDMASGAAKNVVKSGVGNLVQGKGVNLEDLVLKGFSGAAGGLGSSLYGTSAEDRKIGNNIGTGSANLLTNLYKRNKGKA